MTKGNKSQTKSLLRRITSAKLDRSTKLLIAITFMSICDAVFTLAWLNFGIADEANPILLYSLELGEPYFLLSKISLTILGCFLLYRVRSHKLTEKAILFIAGVYFVLTAYHLVGASLSLSFADVKHQALEGVNSLKALLGL